MDFPSSERFCSPAGQIQPQHAWLRTAAAHPQQLRPAVRGARLGSGARQLCSSLALPGAPGSAAGAAHELPT